VSSVEIIGRHDPVERLSAWLRDDAPRRLRIASISGPGGVGKTFLLDHVLAGTDLRARKFLTLRVQGTDTARTLADLVTRDLVTSAREITGPRARAFGVTLNLRRNLEIIDEQIRAEVQDALRGVDDSLGKPVADLFALGVGVLEWVPHPSAQLAARLGGKVDTKALAQVLDRVQRARALATERRLWNGILPDWRQAGARNRLRMNLAEELAEALIIDLSALLAGWRRRDWARALPDKLPGHDRLLLIIDDLESVSAVVMSFLLEHLLPRLADARFETLLICVGRDRLVDTHPGWKQHFAPYLLGDIALSSFSPEDAERYVREAGVTSDAAVARIVADTQGFPYLLASEVEAELDGGRSALALKLFVDRTTRWMTPEQRRWLRALCFLDPVTVEGIQRMLPDAPAEEVLTWFKTEASIRDPRAQRWSVLPIIRSRVRAYVENDSPAEYRQWLERAA
jgi:hypothetical protein